MGSLSNSPLPLPGLLFFLGQPLHSRVHFLCWRSPSTHRSFPAQHKTLPFFPSFEIRRQFSDGRDGGQKTSFLLSSKEYVEKIYVLLFVPSVGNSSSRCQQHNFLFPHKNAEKKNSNFEYFFSRWLGGNLRGIHAGRIIHLFWSSYVPGGARVGKWRHYSPEYFSLYPGQQFTATKEEEKDEWRRAGWHWITAYLFPNLTTLHFRF